MKKFQAAMRDVAAKKMRESRAMFRVGSVFKGCRHCGDYEEEISSNGKVRKIYSSGFQVFRSYEPKLVGWTWWCWECGAKDLQAWEPDDLGLIEAELGKPPVQGTRESKVLTKYRLRKEALGKVNKPKVARESEIDRIERELRELMALLKADIG